MEHAPIVMMKDRRHQIIPIAKIRVPNPRERDETQFNLNVESIDAVGQIKAIRVNDMFLETEGFYELVFGEGRMLGHIRLQKTHIRAEIVTCTRKQAYLQSLVENIARSRPDTMMFAIELKTLHDEGWSYESIAKIACHTEEYVRQYIRLVEKGERRLIRGVEQNLFPISFAILVAQSDDTNIQNVLMDAFDQGIVNCQNFARARAIINSRTSRPHRKKNGATKPDYSLATLTHDIANATQEKDSYVREAQAKESRVFALLDGLESLWKDDAFRQLIEAESIGQRPELAGRYNLCAA